MDVLTGRVARILYAAPMGVFGLFHFMNANGMAGMVPIPGGVFWVYLTGLGLLAACVSIIIGKKARLAALLLGVMLAIFALSIHLPGMFSAASEQAAQASTASFLKDIALAGAAFLIAGISSDD